MIINLSTSDLQEADYIADMRFADAYLNGYADKHGLDSRNAQTVHTLGARGEKAAAVALSYRGPLTINTFKSAGDLGEFQVRTRSKHWYELIIRADDADAVFVLVTTEHPYFSFNVRGWIGASEARGHLEWQRTYGNRELAWFVPHHALHEMETLT